MQITVFLERTIHCEHLKIEPDQTLFCSLSKGYCVEIDNVLNGAEGVCPKEEEVFSDYTDPEIPF